VLSACRVRFVFLAANDGVSGGTVQSSTKLEESGSCRSRRPRRAKCETRFTLTDTARTGRRPLEKLDASAPKRIAGRRRIARLNRKDDSEDPSAAAASDSDRRRRHRFFFVHWEDAVRVPRRLELLLSFRARSSLDRCGSIGDRRPLPHSAPQSPRVIAAGLVMTISASVPSPPRRPDDDEGRSHASCR